LLRIRRDDNEVSGGRASRGGDSVIEGGAALLLALFIRGTGSKSVNIYFSVLYARLISVMECFAILRHRRVRRLFDATSTLAITPRFIAYNTASPANIA
jgi:hypothetical protein